MELREGTPFFGASPETNKFSLKPDLNHDVNVIQGFESYSKHPGPKEPQMIKESSPKGSYRIVYSNLPKGLINSTLEVCINSINKCRNSKDLRAEIVAKMEELTGGSWTCTLCLEEVGSFGMTSEHFTKQCVHLIAGGISIILVHDSIPSLLPSERVVPSTKQEGTETNLAKSNTNQTVAPVFLPNVCKAKCLKCGTPSMMKKGMSINYCKLCHNPIHFGG